MINGFPDGSFRPNDSITRAQYAAMLAQVLQPGPERSPRTFTDVAAGFWAASSIQTAYRAGFMSGVSATQFGPNQPLQKTQLLVSLASGLDWPDGTASDLAFLSDAAEIPKWAVPKIAAAVNKQTMVNAPNVKVFDPDRPATRAEVAASLYQTLLSYDSSLASINSGAIATA